MKVLIIAALLAIIVSLGQALFAMSSGHGNSARMVRALTLRIGISVALFAGLMLAWYFGLIDPHGVS